MAHAQRKRGIDYSHAKIFKDAKLMTKYFNHLRITKIKIMIIMLKK